MFDTRPLSRRTLLGGSLALAATTAASPLLLPASRAAADSARGGRITRTEVIARAQIWVDRQPGPYDQGGFSPGPGDGYNYRRDCSGYVSMCWHLDANPSTQGIPGYATEIAWSDLKPGDVLNSFYNHVFLFHRWLDGNGNFEYYSFGATPVSHDRANINDAVLDGHPRSEYKALRYRNIVDETAPAARPPMPYESGRVVSGRSLDGRLETFAAGSDGVWHAYQTKVNGDFSSWERLGGPTDAKLALVANPDGRLELFALSSTTLQHIWQLQPNQRFSGWAPLGSGGTDLTAGANADGRIEVFASNPKGVFHTWQTTPGQWAEWTGVGGPSDARLKMAMSSDGRLEVFALNGSTFGHLFQTRPSGSFGAWEDFGTGGHDLTVDHNADGRLEVFASGPKGVFHKWQTSGTTWSAWTPTGGPADSELATERTADGRVEVYAVNADVLQHAWQTKVNGQYSAWETFGTGGTEVVGTKNADGRIELFATSRAGVFHRWQTGFSTWSDWRWLADSAGPGLA